MATDRSARDTAHKGRVSGKDISSAKRQTRRQFRRIANHELRQVLISGNHEDHEYVGPSFNKRLTSWDVD